MTVERKEGNDVLFVALPGSGKHILVGVDCPYKSTRCSGIQGVDGASFVRNSATHVRRDLVFPMGKPVAVSCEYSPEALAIQIEGHTIVDWRGDVSLISENVDWVTSEPHVIIGSVSASFEFRDIQLKFIDE
jgi:hypothetical protein